RRDDPFRAVAGGTNLTDWRVALGALGVAARHADRSDVPAQQRGTAGQVGAVAVPACCNAPHARDSSLHRSGRDRLELVEWSDAVGLAAWNAAFECAAAGHHHWRASLQRSGASYAAESVGPTLRERPYLARSGPSTAGTPPEDRSGREDAPLRRLTIYLCDFRSSCAN